MRAWALGSTALLDTVGGTFERWWRDRGAPVVLALSAIVAVKSVIAVAAALYAGLGPMMLTSSAAGKPARTLGWVAATVLVVWGVLTLAGLAVETGIIEATADSDGRALAWHTYFWDPWFVVWGGALMVTVWLTRRPRAAGTTGRLSRPGGVQPGRRRTPPELRRRAATTGDEDPGWSPARTGARRRPGG